MDRGTDWADQAFGARARALRERIPAALAEAHRRARASHDAGRSRNQLVYGTALWVFQHEELAAAIGAIDGASVAKLGAYELPVVARKVLFPLKYAELADVPVERARLEPPVSGLRERLFGAHAPAVEHSHPYLDESWSSFTPNYQPFPQLGRDAEVVVIAYACNVEAGLLHLEWGRAEHIGGGELRWGEHSPLPVPSDQGRRLAAVGRNGDARFDTGAEPGLGLGLRHPGAGQLDVPPQTEHHPDRPRAEGQ